MKLIDKDNREIVVVEQHRGAHMIAGALAGWVAVLTTNPLDVIKTRLQTQHHQQQFEKEAVKTLYRNSFAALQHMYKHEGVRSFWKGTGPRLITTTFFSSWFGVVYELILDWSKE